jgi:hypothetical protein
MDNPGLYVSLSRDKGQVVLFGARAELEGDRETLVYGPPRNQTELTDRVIAALAEKAAATADNANDRPVLVDLGHTPAAEPVPPSAPPPARPPARRPAWAPPQRERTPEPERGPAPAGLTDEQRNRRDVGEPAARVTGDAEAAQAIEAAKRVAFGPSDRQHARRQRDLAGTEPQPAHQPPDPASTREREPQSERERELDRQRRRAAWAARPHGRW